MPDEAFDPGTFLVKFPIWTIVNVKVLQESGPGPAIATCTAPEIGQFIPIFTDEDLAKQFMEKVETPPGFSRLGLRTLKALRVIVAGWDKGEVHHVGIDVSFAEGRSPSGRFYPSQSILSAIPPDAT
jgi:hypothetical protein